MRRPGAGAAAPPPARRDPGPGERPPRRRPLSLRTQFALIAAILVALVTLALTLLVSDRIGTRIRHHLGEDLVRVAVEMADRLGDSVIRRSEDLSMVATVLGATGPLDRPHLQRALDRLSRGAGSFSWLGVTDPSGTVLADTSGLLAGTDIGARPAVRFGRERPYIGRATDVRTLLRPPTAAGDPPIEFFDVGAPLRGADGRLLGVLVGHISWKWVRDVNAQLLGPAYQRHAADVLVVGDDGRLLLGQSLEALGTRLDMDVLETARSWPRGWAIQKWPDGRRYLTGFARETAGADEAGLRWTVLVRQPLDEAYEPVTALQRHIAAWGAGLAALFAAAAWAAASLVAAPLGHLTEAADRLGQGEAVDLPVLRSSREVEGLSSALVRMVEALTSQERALATMHRAAHADGLTGLANRRGLDDYLVHRAGEASPERDALCLLMLDLDGFKPVNDTHGHAIGDHLLRAVANRLVACVRARDLVARLGGDEFVLVLATPHDQAEEEARRVAGRVLEVLSDPFFVEGKRLVVSGSIGVAVWPRDARDFDALFRHADAALYRAKDAGKNRAAFHGEGCTGD